MRIPDFVRKVAIQANEPVAQVAETLKKANEKLEGELYKLIRKVEDK